MRLSRDGAWNRIWVYDFSNETIKILKKKNKKGRKNVKEYMEGHTIYSKSKKKTGRYSRARDESLSCSRKNINICDWETTHSTSLRNIPLF